MSHETAPEGVPEPPGPARLRRALGMPLVLAYGLGTIIGAGIYVALGQVVAEAGAMAPIAFIVAGALAALTGLVYAEFTARQPEAAGAAAYVQAAFGSPALARATGVAVAGAAMVAASSIARGGAGFLAQLVPVSEPLGAALIVAAFTALACRGVVESVSVAAAITVLEIAGLLFVMATGAAAVPSSLWAYLPAGVPATATLLGVASGAFIAFFAFIGFETMANMAEETRDVIAVLPRAIVLAVLISTLLYAGVALVAVAAVAPEDLARSPLALCRVIEARGHGCGTWFTGIALIATLNGVLVEIIMVARLAYGMSRRGWLPPWFGHLGARHAVPTRATLACGAMVLVLAVVLDFRWLVAMTSALTLAVFALVSVGLWRVQIREPRSDLAIRAPRWVPPLAALSCLALMAAALA